MSNYSGLILQKLTEYFEHRPHGAQVDFCRDTGIKKNALKNWLSGRTKSIPLDEIDAIARGLGYPSGGELLRAPKNETEELILIRDIVRMLSPLKKDKLRTAKAVVRGLVELGVGQSQERPDSVEDG